MFEYTKIEQPHNIDVSALNDLAKQGWRVITVMRNLTPLTDSYVTVMERALPAAETEPKKTSPKK